MREYLKDEIWKPVKGYEGLYEVSDRGRIKHLPYNSTSCFGSRFIKERILKPHKQNGGYLMIDLHKNNKRKNELVHRVVAKSFLDNQNNLTDVNHKDGNRVNNNLSNLEWCSRSYNIRHSFEKLGRKCWMKGMKGGLNHNSKKVAMYKDNVLIKRYSSIMDIERETGMLNNAICQNLKGKSKKSYGFTFKYIKNES